jgi:hypothetical protein
VLLHQASYAEWSADPVDLALTVLATAVLLRPLSLAPFAALLFLQIVDLVLELPWVSNHWLFAGCAAATILAALAQRRVLQRWEPLDRDALLESFAPWVRLQLVVLYAFAVLHKLNFDFLDPDTSCAAVHSDALMEALAVPLPAGPTRQAVITLTLAIEVLVPIGLTFRRTGAAAMLLGGVFHGAIGLNLDVAPFYNFSSLVFACYALFLPEDFLAALRQRLDGLAASLRRRPLQALRWARRLLAAGGLLLVLSGVWVGQSWSLDANLLRSLWALYTFGLMALVVLGYAGTARGRVPLMGRPAGLAIFPALLILNGLSPYLGFKTETSFGMFSNLRTEGELGNHLFLRRAPRIASLQEGLVKVLDSSDPGLRRVSRSPLLFVFFEFRDYVSRRPEASVRYLRRDRLFEVARVADDPLLSHPTSPWARKLLIFRLVDPRGRCRH